MAHTYVYNPELPFVQKGAKGNRMTGNRFVTMDEMNPVGFSTVMRWAFSKNPQREEKKADRFRLPVKKDERIMLESADALNWLGHSAFLLRLNGTLLLTDPCLFSSTGLKRLVDTPFLPEEIHNPAYVLLSHTHRDHFDTGSLKRILKHHPDVHFLAPLRTGRLLKKLGTTRYTEAAWYQHYNGVKEMEIIFLPAHHWNRRWMNDTNRELWGSFIIRTGNKTIYFAGDTAYAGHFKEIRKLIGNIDYVFMPIAAYRPDWMMRRAHVSPQEAVNAFNELGAKYLIPMHYGTFDLSDEPLGEPIRLLKQMYESGQIEGQLIVPAVGETVRL